MPKPGINVLMLNRHYNLEVLLLCGKENCKTQRKILGERRNKLQKR